MKTHIPGAFAAFAIPALCLLGQPVFADGNFGNFTYTEDATSVTITDYAEDAPGAVGIPATINGKPVVAIGERAFARCDITTVSMPDSIVTVGASAFADSAATSVTFSPNVTVLGEKVFYRCRELQEVSLPPGVTTIPSATFNGCRKLDEIGIPAGVTSIGVAAFHGCFALESLIIPGSVKVIGPQAFRGCKRLETLTLSEGLETIGSNSFYNCNALQDVTIPSTVTTIGSLAFRRENYPLKTMTFLGDAPVMGGVVPGNVFIVRPLKKSPPLVIYFKEGATGFSTPKWLSQWAVELQDGPGVAVQEPEYNYLPSKGAKKAFGTTAVGESRRWKTFTISNTGTETLTALEIRVTGANPMDFPVDQPNKTTVAPGESRIFKVTFKPKASGDRKAKLKIVTSQTSGEPFNIAVSGTGEGK
ncbi:MAG: leucine-rich repeat protein [Verrucomicrobiota bacterium]